MKSNKSIKEHVNLYFKYDLSYKNYACLKIITLIMNDSFKKFLTRYEYLSWRRNSFGGYHINKTTTIYGNLVYSIDLVSIKDKFLKVKSTWCEEFIKLLFTEDSFQIDDTILENAKNTLITNVKNDDYDASYSCIKEFSKQFLDKETYRYIFPDDISLINEITKNDVLDCLNHLKDHLFKVSYFNVEQEKINKIKSVLPSYNQELLTYNFININKYLIKDSIKNQNINSSSCCLLYYLNQEKYVFESRLLLEYLKNVKSFIFEIIREKYGLIYSYQIFHSYNSNYFILEMKINQKNISVVKDIFFDFLNNPKKYLSFKVFRQTKKEFLNLFISNKKNSEYIFKFEDKQYYSNHFISFNEFINRIHELKYNDIINLIKNISFSGEYFMECGKNE